MMEFPAAALMSAVSVNFASPIQVKVSVISIATVQELRVRPTLIVPVVRPASGDIIRLLVAHLSVSTLPVARNLDAQTVQEIDEMV